MEGGLINPRPWRGRCRAGYSNTGGPPLPRKRAPYKNRTFLDQSFKLSIFFRFFLNSLVAFHFCQRQGNLLVRYKPRVCVHKK